MVPWEYLCIYEILDHFRSIKFGIWLCRSHTLSIEYVVAIMFSEYEKHIPIIFMGFYMFEFVYLQEGML